MQICNVLNRGDGFFVLRNAHCPTGDDAIRRRIHFSDFRDLLTRKSGLL
jgi:hypothetical protein